MDLNADFFFDGKFRHTGVVICCWYDLTRCVSLAASFYTPVLLDTPVAIAWSLE